MGAKSMKDLEAVRKAVELYIEGGKQGKSEVMRKAFHPEAIMYGQVGGGLMGGGIQTLFDIIDSKPPAQSLEAEITHIDVEGGTAWVRLEADKWNGARYTDMFLLVKDGEEWKILTKIFQAH